MPHPRVMDYAVIKEYTAAYVSAVVVERMARQKLSKRKLSRLANVPYTTIIGLVNDDRDIHLSTLARLAQGFGCTMSDLLPETLP